MLEKSFGLFYYLKLAKNQKSKRYIYLRITVNGKFCDLSIKRLWESHKWNTSFGRAIGDNKEIKELNSYLDLILSKVYQAKTKLHERSKPITAESIKEVLLGKDEKKHLIKAVFLEHNIQMKALVGKNVAEGTLTRYKTAYLHTSSFIRWRYGKEDMELVELNYEFIDQFLFWLKSERNCGHNTAVKYLGPFKKIIIGCLKSGLLKTDPFQGVKFKRIEVHPIVLTKEEIVKIINKKYGIERLKYVRDIFLFSCYTGLSYSDVYRLQSSDIVTGIDGEKWIITSRKKTGSPTRLPILPYALEILKRYENHPKCLDNRTAFPVLTNQKMNSYLKEIADTCGIKKKLTFHTAMHTFATTITLNNGVPMETVSKMMGHKSLKHTQHYARVIDLKVSEDMKQLKKKLELA